MRVGKDGKPTPDTWPNTGIGRINLDGSRGTCSACHQRHVFSAAQARKPETCGKCHLGPDHPQKEIYEESKHGISYFANAGTLNIDNPKWIVGEDYSLADLRDVPCERNDVLPVHAQYLRRIGQNEGRVDIEASVILGGVLRPASRIANVPLRWPRGT